MAPQRPDRQFLARVAAFARLHGSVEVRALGGAGREPSGCTHRAPTAVDDEWRVWIMDIRHPHSPEPIPAPHQRVPPGGRVRSRRRGTRLRVGERCEAVVRHPPHSPSPQNPHPLLAAGTHRSGCGRAAARGGVSQAVEELPVRRRRSSEHSTFSQNKPTFPPCDAPPPPHHTQRERGENRVRVYWWWAWANDTRGRGRAAAKGGRREERWRMQRGQRCDRGHTATP
jgi:hypothetical protein